MKIASSLFVVLFLLMYISSEAQKKKCTEEIVIIEIKDSLINENYSYKYVLPKIVTKGEFLLERLDNIIAKTIFSTSLTKNTKEINDSTLTGIESCLNKEIERLKGLKAKGMGSHNNNKFSYLTKFNSEGLLSFAFLTTKTENSIKTQSISYLSLDSKTGKEILFDDIMIDTLSLPLLAKIEIRFYRKVMKEIESSTNSISMKNDIRSFLIVNNEDNFPIRKSPKGYFCTNNNGNAGMCFLIDTEYPKVFQSLSWFVNGYFFSFEELKPYLKEDFKKRIGLK